MCILSDYGKFQLFNCFKIMKMYKSKARNEKNDSILWEVRPPDCSQLYNNYVRRLGQDWDQLASFTVFWPELEFL